MIKSLLAIVRALYSAPTFELLGAAAVTWAAYLLGGWPAALIVIGAALLLKSLALDFSGPGKTR